jgi:hypothetical protein
MGVVWNIYKGLRVWFLGAGGRGNLVVNLDRLNQKQVQEK